MTVKAVAYDAAGNASGIASETYTFPVACENIAAAKAQATGTLVVLTFKDGPDIQGRSSGIRKLL